MNIEHIAFNVPDPCATAAWYIRHLGMRVARKGPPPGNGHFLACPSADGAVDPASTMVEIYLNPAGAVPDYKTIDPPTLHLAFRSDDVQSDRARLIAAGAAPEGEVLYADDGDVLAMLRDPWGLPIQLAKRARPMP